MANSLPPIVDPERFLNNLRALWRQDPELAMRIDAVADEERLPLERARSGDFTVSMPTPQGSPVYLHSRVDPAAEAARLAEAVSVDDRFCFVVSGFGLGYHVRALFERVGAEAIIVCTEPSLPLLSTAFACVDLHDVIASGRLILLTDEDKARAHERLKPHNTLMMLGARFVRHPPSIQVAEQRQAALGRLIADFASYTRMSVMTLVSNARVTCRNIAMNLVHYVTTPSIDLLRNRFEGNPAIVVSAGPSLSRNIDRLASLQGKAVICAVQTALQPLTQRGIVPDFVTCLDFHEMSRKFFAGIGCLKDVYLVAEPKAAWRVLDEYPGPVFLLNNDWARLVIGDELGARGGLPAGATVAHLAFYLAVHLGCDPILFVGQDLAFTGHVFYTPGVEIHHAWRGELNRFHSLEHKEWERIARNRPILRRVTGGDGEELYTDELLFTYLEQFEKDIAGSPVRVINATQGGARIRGTQAMSLQEAQERFCEKPVDPARFAYRKTACRRDLAKLEPTSVELSRRIDELNGVVQVCEELVPLLKELETLTDDPPRFNRRLIRVDELRAQVSQEARAYRIVSAAAQLAEFRRFSADRRIGTEGPEDAARATRRLARDVEFITGIRDGAVETGELLRRALERVRERMASS